MMVKRRAAQLPRSQDRNETAEARDERVRRLVGEGAQLLAARRVMEALPMLQEARELDRDNAAAAINLGGAYILLGKHALALDPLAPHVHYNLGLIYLERDDPAQAAQHFAAALDADPYDTDARHWLDKISSGSAPDAPPQE